MIDVTFKINNVDYSSLLSTYTVTHEVEYPKVMVAIDGTEYGSARRRPVVKFSLLPLTDAQTSELYTTIALMNVICEYTDPYIGETTVANMRVTSNLESAFGLRAIDGNRYYKGGSITLRQRTVL